MKEKSITQAIDNNHWSNRKMEEKKITESSTVKDVVEIVRDDLKKVLKMKENEPKVKYSQKWWDKKKFFRGTIQHDVLFGLCEKDKATYDRLVTLEAKIEVKTELVENLKNRLYNPVKAGDYWSQEWLKWLIKDLTESNHYESELAELVKELKI